MQSGSFALKQLEGSTKDMDSYYTSHSSFTDPGEYADLYRDLPDDLPDLIAVLQGVLIHKLVVDFYQVQLSPVQRAEQRLRSMQQRLQRLVELNYTSLLQPLPPQERQVGVCRDFAVFLVSLLRHKGIPARMRVGFAAYLDPSGTYRYDHWITEYLDTAHEQWRLVDPQIDDIQRQHLKITANTLNLRGGKDFYLAGQAWQLCRQGKDRSLLFRFNGHWKGMPCIRGNLMHDFRALNKVELTPFDVWDSLSTRAETQLSIEDKATLDQVAELTLAPDERLAEIEALHASLPGTQEVESRLRLLGLYRSQAQGGPPRLQGSALEQLATHGAHPGNGKPLPQDLVPYEVPEDTPLARLMEAQAIPQPDLFAGDIIVRGAQQHNLKRIDVVIPRHRMVVVTGVSGSGKSSLAFDTIYAEGQRRYVESLSSYARQFMEQMEKPKVDQITGLSPAIAIEQKTVSRNPRSTVGTVTEILDYLRVLYARAGLAHCPECGRAVQPQTAQQITNRLAALPPGTRFQLLAPMARGRKGAYHAALKQAAKDGFTRARVNGFPLDLSDPKAIDDLKLDKNRKQFIELVVDRLIIAPRNG
jgi:excinuclease ABC subunit A